MDFFFQRVNVPVAQFPVIDGLAIGAECADAFAERDVDIEAQATALIIRQCAVIFIFKGKGLP